MGRVRWDSEEFEGLHPPLVTPDLFAKVETVLELRDYAGARDNRHFHHLKGTLRCGECGALLSFSRSKGRSDRYDYFYCLGKSRCSQPYARTDHAERLVEALYPLIAMPKNTATELREGVHDAISSLRGADDGERLRLTRRIERLKGQRVKLLDAHYAGAIPLDLLKSEQTRISSEIAQATHRIDCLATKLDRAGREIDKAIEFAWVAAARYGRFSPDTHRKFNRAIFKAMYFRDKQLVRFEYTPLMEPLIANRRLLGRRFE